jgi:HAE1 family hydrophobic/amphiphilic exporter-1
VTKKIEDAVAGLTGVKHITSSITDGASSTTIEFRLEVNTDRAVNDVKDAVARIRSDLPRTSTSRSRSASTSRAADPDLCRLCAKMTLEDISWRRRHGDPQPASIKGVAGVTRVGGVEREIRVKLDPDR